MTDKPTNKPNENSGAIFTPEEAARINADARRDVAARGGPRTSHINVEGHAVQAEAVHDGLNHEGGITPPNDTWVQDDAARKKADNTRQV